MTPIVKRVVFINRSYWPDTEATGQLLTQLCEDIAEEFAVEVVCGLPNHVSDTSANWRDSRSWGVTQLEERNGVTIRRVRHTRFDKKSLIGRLTNLVTFTLAAFLATWRMPRPDVVVTETDPFFLPLLGRFLQWRHRCRYVAYLQDIYPDVAVAVGKVREGAVVRTLRAILFGIYRRADRVIVLSRDMRDRCLMRGVPERKIAIIPNWTDTHSIHPVKEENAFREEHSLGDRFVVMYSGNMGLAHELSGILEAAEKLQDRPDIEFLFVGGGVQRPALEAEAARRQLPNVRFLPYQPWETLALSLSAADLHIVSLKPDVAACLMPSKLYGILATATPVLAIAPSDSELARIVTETELGYLCATDEPSQMAERIAFVVNFLADRPHVARQMGLRARELAESDYDRRHCIAQFEAMLHDVLGQAAAIPAATPATLAASGGE